MSFREPMEGQPECFVSGALATVLRVSRCMGLAPLTFIKKRTGWRIRLSPNYSFYGYFLSALINLFIIAAIVEDLSVDRDESFRVRTNTRCIVWIIDSCYFIILSSVCVYRSTGMMKSLISCLNRLQKINYELNIYHWPNWLEKQKTILFVIWMSVTVALSTVDHVLLTINFIGNSNISDTRPVWISVMYSFYYCCYWIVQLQEIQFIMTSMHVFYTFKAVNVGLRNVLEDTLKPYKPVFVLLGENKSNINKRKTCKRLNGKIGDFGKASLNKANADDNIKTHDEKVRTLASVYARVCDVVREVDQSYGLILLLMLGSWLYHLVITPYYLINNIFDKSMVHTEYSRIFMVVQLTWCLLHATSLILVIEPCHMTHMEMETTKELISQLMCYTNSSSEALAAELEMFFNQLMLNKVSYSPLKVTTLRRSLVVRMFRSITTYLVVLVQL